MEHESDSVVRRSDLALEAELAASLEVINATLVDNVEAIYLHGSAVLGGLRPASDLDLLVITTGATTSEQRRQLVERLAPVSDRRLRPPAWRPIELTIVVATDIRPWRYPPRMEFQWGEWLRAAFEGGTVPAPRDEPDLAIVLTMARSRARTLAGQQPTDLIPAIPDDDLVQAMTHGIDSLVADLEYDTANMLLTLARIWNTLESGTFAPKNVAADWATARMNVGAGNALRCARDVYLGLAEDTWEDLRSEVRADADQLLDNIRLATEDRAATQP